MAVQGDTFVTAATLAINVAFVVVEGAVHAGAARHDTSPLVL
jgi:hypothetical protein